MDSLSTSNLSAFASSDPKTAVMNQIRQEAAVQNARQLVEVPTFSLTHTQNPPLGLIRPVLGDLR